jgi:predicted DNA binding CopG/RHH family protein
MVEFIDEEEKEIIESLYNEEWVSDFDDETKKMYEEYAKYSIERTKEINFKISEKDFDKIKVKAMQEGIDYEVLLSMLIHKYNEGKIAINV